MNILLLTADSLRADRTSLFGHSRDTTPFLADLAADAFEFRRAYANGFNTASSFPAVHTSTHASYYEGVGIPESGTPTLAEVLRDGGYRTHAIHTNELVSRDYNYDRGFDAYRDSRSGGGDGDSDTSGWRARAGDAIEGTPLFEVAKRAHFFSTEYLGVKIFDTSDAVSGFADDIRAWVTGADGDWFVWAHYMNPADGDWFVWAHYMNPHHPYEPPADCQEALGLDPVPTRRATKLSRKMRLHPETVTDEERATLRGLYDASVLSWDREVASTCRRLEAAGELSDTLVVVSADHGELLGEDDQYGHPPVLDQPLLRVPLVFAGGPVEAGESRDQVGLVDLAPTLATLADQAVPDGWHGRLLFDAEGSPRLLDPSVQFSEVDDGEHPRVAGIDDDRKVVHDVERDVWRSFELPDPERLSERAVEADYEDLQSAVCDHESAAADNRAGGATVDQAQLRDDLAALGYLDE